MTAAEHWSPTFARRCILALIPRTENGRHRIHFTAREVAASVESEQQTTCSVLCRLWDEGYVLPVGCAFKLSAKGKRAAKKLLP